MKRDQKSLHDFMRFLPFKNLLYYRKDNETNLAICIVFSYCTNSVHTNNETKCFVVVTHHRNMALNGLSARAFCNRKRMNLYRKGLVAYLNIGDLPLVEGQKRNHRLMSKNIKLTIMRQSNNKCCFPFSPPPPLPKIWSPCFFHSRTYFYLSINVFFAAPES